MIYFVVCLCETFKQFLSENENIHLTHLYSSLLLLNNNIILYNNFVQQPKLIII